MNSYPDIYESYVRFCQTVGSPALAFEEWMLMRDYVSDESYEARHGSRQEETYVQL